MKKKNVAVVLVGLIFIIALCAPVVSAATQNIRFWSDQSEPWQQEVIKAMIADFEAKNPDIKVEVEYIGWKDRQPKMTAAIATNTEPEVALLSSQYATSLPAQGVLATLDDVVADMGGEDVFFGASLSLAKYKGHFYSVPYTTLPVVLWYRKDRLAEAGLQPPTNWEELYNAAKILTEKGKGSYFGLGTPFGRSEWTDETFRALGLWATGGKVFDENGNVIINSPETVRALKYYKSLYPFTPTGSETWSYAETMNSFISGTAAMTIYFGRTLKNLEQYSPDILKVTGAILPPKDKFHRTTNPPQSIGIFAKSKNPEAGKKFLKFFLTSDHYIKFLWATPGHNVPVLKAKAEAWRQNELLKSHPDIVDVLLKACDPDIGFSPTKAPGNTVASPYWKEIRGAMVIPDAVQKVTLKNEDPQKVAEWMEKEIKRIISEAKM